jgi:hypothetical protein
MGARDHLERAGKTFVAGYNAALEKPNFKPLIMVLNRNDPEMVGFAFEGAAMALTILDLITPWKRNRLQAFLDNAGENHLYMIHVGAGWALARLKRQFKPFIERLHPVLHWLVLDGYGFHQGYFHSKRYVEQKEMPSFLPGYASRAFDQGLGRSLWFVFGADVDRIPGEISGFAQNRQADIWSGIGLACGYAGKPTDLEIMRLHNASNPYQQELAQGAAFAAKARSRAGNLMEHTDRACRILCGMTADQAAEISDQTFENLPTDEDVPAYEIWRSRIRARFEQIEHGKTES